MVVKFYQPIDVVAMLLFRNDEVLVAQRPTGDNYQGFWEFPGGKVEKDESFEQALVREILEELQITINVAKHFITVENGGQRLRLHAYTCDFIRGEIRLKVHSAVSWVKVIDLRSLKMLPLDLKIVDALRLHI